MKKIMLLILVAAVFITLSGCSLTGRVIFTNWNDISYDCLIDGEQVGTVGPYGNLAVSNVELGRHMLVADDPDSTADYVTAMEIYIGDNLWDFNKP